MDNQGVIEDVEEAQKCCSQGASRNEKENEEEDRSSEPREECGKEAVPDDGETILKIACGIVRIQELRVIRAHIENFLSCGDEELPQRGMLFHEEHAIQIFLRRGHMVILIPEESCGLPKVMEVREVR